MEEVVDQRGKILEKHRGGLVQVYTGNGKGKTTAAFGQELRTKGRTAPDYKNPSFLREQD